MTDFNKYVKEKLKDTAIKAEYDVMEPEFDIIQTIIDARKISGLTQKELAERSGIAQPDISKIENGNANFSIKTLQKLATAFGKKLKIGFIS